MAKHTRAKHAPKKKAAKKTTKHARLLEKLIARGAVRHSLLLLADAGGAEEVDVSIDAEEARAFINGVPLQLSGGKGSMQLLPGHHILSFEVRGAPGTKFSVKITAPPEAKSEDGDTFDETGFDAGRIKFVVGS